jgi:hypothetical protein
MHYRGNQIPGREDRRLPTLYKFRNWVLHPISLVWDLARRKFVFH